MMYPKRSFFKGKDNMTRDMIAILGKLISIQR